MNRKDFIRSCSAGAFCFLAEGPLGAFAAADDPNLYPRTTPFPQPVRRADGSYSVVLLGDIHFDGTDPQTYHANYPNENETAANVETQRKEFARNAEMWSARLPSLLAAAGRSRRADTAFVLQLGDLVQGDCNDSAVHKQMCEDAVSAIRSGVGSGVPIALVVGNHDIRNGASSNSEENNYRSWFVKRMQSELSVNAANFNSANFWRMQGPDLWIHVDFTKPSRVLDFVEAALAAGSGARYKFLVTHAPALPPDTGNYTAMLMRNTTASDYTKQRRQLRTMLLRNDVIVLAGHIHTTELAEVVTDDGRITQLTASCVWTKDGMRNLVKTHSTPAQYGDRQTTDAGRSYLGEYKGAMTRYFRSTAAGFFRLEVSPKGVAANFFGGDADQPSATWLLR